MFESTKNAPGSLEADEDAPIDGVPPSDELDEHDLGWEEGDPADRRKDPLRKP